MTNLFGHLVKEKGDQVTDDNLRSLIFGDYLSKGRDEKLYDEIMDLKELTEVSVFCYF
jgi:dynein heavy chain